ncbi:hypothetical protein KJ966_24935 [bacterium]|nr:hypothetical protein [bacterium]
MTSAVFPSKVISPTLTGIYHRNRIYQILRKSRNKSVVWIGGPAGAGKTTVVGGYLEKIKISHCYYQIDDSDDDVASFFFNMRMAAQESGFSSPDNLPFFTPEYTLGLPAFCRRFFQTMFSGLSLPFVIVFDNFQELPENPAMLTVFHVLLEILPKDIQVFFISRSEPSSNLAKFRLDHKMEVISWQKLRLTGEEAQGVLRTRINDKIPGKLVEKLNNRSDGWMAGLILLAESARQSGFEPNLSLETCSELTFDYLSNEVFRHFDCDKKDFLIKSALLTKMPVELVSKLTLHDSARILPDLKKNNYFIEFRPGETPVYQYHALFRQFLLNRAKELLTESEIRCLSIRAALLLEENGQVDESLRLLGEIGDWSAMAELINRSAGLFLNQTKWKTLENWIEKIPEKEIDTHPWLYYWLAICKLPYNPTQARIIFEKAYALLLNRNDPVKMMMIIAGAAEATFVEGRNFHLLNNWIDKMVQLVSENKGFPSREIEERSASTIFGAMVNRQPDHPDFKEWLERTRNVLLNSLDENLKLVAGFALCSHYLYTGDFSSIGFIVDTLRRQTEGGEAHPFWIVLVRLASAGRYWLTGHSDQCLQETEAALSFSEEQGIHLWDAHFLGFGAAGALSGGNYDLARNYLERMSQAMIPGMLYTVAMYHCISAWLHLLAGDLRQAENHAETALKMAEELGGTIPLVIGYQAVCLCKHQKGKPEQALKISKKAIALSERMDSSLLRFQSMCTHAILMFDCGTRDQVVQSLEKAMILGHRGDLLNFWLFLPRVMTRLCLTALELGIETPYVQKLVSLRNLQPDHPPVSIAVWPWRIRFYTLGSFRFEIDGTEQRFKGKPPKKPLEMLRLIVTLGGKDIDEDRVTDALWPDAEGDSGHKNFEITLHRLRKLIGVDDCIHMNEGRLSLNPVMCYLDYQQFEALDRKIKNSDLSLDQKLSHQQEIDLLEEAISLYHGHYSCQESWAISIRENLRRTFVKLLLRLGNLLEAEGEYRLAADRYLKGLRIDNTIEEFYRCLILCYHSQGLISEAEKTYRLYEQTMKSNLNLPVSEEMTELLRKITLSSV